MIDHDCGRPGCAWDFVPGHFHASDPLHVDEEPWTPPRETPEHPGTDDDPRLFVGGLWLGFTVAMGVFIALFAVTRMVR